MCNKSPVKTFPTPQPKPKVSNNKASIYYQCLLNESLNGFNGQKITQACRNCKLNGTQLATQRQQEINTLLTAYQQIGNSLRALLAPLEE